MLGQVNEQIVIDQLGLEEVDAAVAEVVVGQRLR